MASSSRMRSHGTVEALCSTLQALELTMPTVWAVMHNGNKERDLKFFAYNPCGVHTPVYMDFKDKTEGMSKDGIYVMHNGPNENKFAMTAINASRNVQTDTPELAAGLGAASPSGQLEFMSGRYLDAFRNIEDLCKRILSYKHTPLIIDILTLSSSSTVYRILTSM
ncbi:uncharacterized protein Z518_10983 [Rhinocladiella mackenziei CBS 650.93]|uniref:Uncharacterized protein n=1 Tax=Rhinocladiella mackenziei CBS 650.93 TaxID=1442369 RepID=A0A0D2I9Y9_9EURO|nr:uncharacterized protein Z518_10983 [Rhinocladiella mackenziei CBS 650.93]KIX00056.1 hypothetical protein Z518_10983 [Rhinocladiella mackenziei CBS 650.93]